MNSPFRKSLFRRRASNSGVSGKTLMRRPCSRRGWVVRLGLAASWCLLSVHPAVAGDILRGGAPMTARPAGGNSGRVAEQAAQARANARDALARTTRAVQSVQKMQQAARAAAAARPGGLGVNPNNPGQLLPAVPNGLVPGGLQLSGSPVGALNPVQSGAGGAAAARVSIKQTAQQALLEWSSFNVGARTALRFDQQAGGANKNQWIAFNKVTDPTGVPSQILGFDPCRRAGLHRQPERHHLWRRRVRSTRTRLSPPHCR